MTQHPERAFIRAVIEGKRRDVAVPTNPLAESLGMTVRTAEDGRVTAGFVADSRFTQGNGVIQGGILATMLDFGMIFAAFSVIPADRTLATVAQTTSFLRPAAPGPFTVEAEVERAGRHVVHARAAIRDAEGRTVATATAPIAVVPMPRTP